MCVFEDTTDIVHQANAGKCTPQSTYLLYVCAILSFGYSRRCSGCAVHRITRYNIIARCRRKTENAVELVDSFGGVYVFDFPLKWKRKTCKAENNTLTLTNDDDISSLPVCMCMCDQTTFEIQEKRASHETSTAAGVDQVRECVCVCVCRYIRCRYICWLYAAAHSRKKKR